MHERAGPPLDRPADRGGVQARGGPLGPEAGFTLIEVLMALAILGFALVALLQLSSQSLRLVKSSGDYQQAMLLADRLATTTQATEETADLGEEGPFRWERRISLVPLPEELQPKETIPGKELPKLFMVTVGVRWGQGQLLELATLRTPTTAPIVPGSQPAAATGTQQPITSGTGQQPTISGSRPGGSTFGSRPGGSTGGFGIR